MTTIHIPQSCFTGEKRLKVGCLGSLQ